ncbi:MAG TPA: PTS sugar transporter subunit IIA [Anaeromyxobacter sp.]
MQLTSREAARLLGVEETTLERWIRDGELAATRVNDRFRLNRIDLLEFASARNLDVSPALLDDLEQESALPGLADAIRAGGVHRDVPGADKSAILRAVVDRLPLPSGVDRNVLHHVLLAREALGSTGLGNGIALPHARNPIVLRVARPAVAICYLARPVDFDALDGKPVHTLLTLVCPSTRAHLRLLALAANALRDPAVLGALEARATAETLLGAVGRFEADLAARRAGAKKP